MDKLCLVCGNFFADKTKFERHFETVHKEQLVSCPVCDDKFNSKRKMWNHKKVHQDIEYNCDLCEYKTKQAGNLTRHKKSKHQETVDEEAEVENDEVSEDKEYKCRNCNYVTELK